MLLLKWKLNNNTAQQWNADSFWRYLFSLRTKMEQVLI